MTQVFDKLFARCGMIATRAQGTRLHGGVVVATMGLPITVVPLNIEQIWHNWSALEGKLLGS